MLFPVDVLSHERYPTYLLPISDAVQIEGALLDILVLREMQRLPVGGKERPFVVSAEGV